MGPLQPAVTWYKIRHAGEQAVHWDIQNKATSSRQICIFFVVDVPVRSFNSVYLRVDRASKRLKVAYNKPCCVSMRRHEEGTRKRHNCAWQRKQ